MSKDLLIYFDEEGVAKAYDDTYDITIHCESEEEQQKAIEQLKSLQWIPCSERLPFVEYGESDNVLTTCGYRDVKDTSVRWIRLLYFNGGNWCYPTGKTYEQKVYAWMPLPEPYREEDIRYLFFVRLGGAHLSEDICILRRCKHAIAETVECFEPKQHERKRGKWEITNLGAVGVFDSCSECKRVVKHKAPFYNYCPNCGADMREDSHETD